jgi:hypothetical protein
MAVAGPNLANHSLPDDNRHQRISATAATFSGRVVCQTNRKKIAPYVTCITFAGGGDTNLTGY